MGEKTEYTDKSHLLPDGIKVNTGLWTEAEHKLFLKGLETFPYGAWEKIATLIKTRTVVQIKSHAQYHQKLAKEQAPGKEQQLSYFYYFYYFYFLALGTDVDGNVSRVRINKGKKRNKLSPQKNQVNWNNCARKNLMKPTRA
jgi:SHAQKYF class myb-like DNA-binding protein